MNNVRARVYNTQQRLEAGWPVDQVGTLLLEAPAQLSSPTRPWERAAALEGVFSATLYLQTVAPLGQADTVFTEDYNSGESRRWRVVGQANTGPEWRLELSSREVRRVP